MKKKVAILGSTGSIGKNTLEVIKKNQNIFKIELLSTNKNVSKIYNQAKKFKVKNIIIHNKNSFEKFKNFFKKKKIRTFQNTKRLFKKNRKLNLIILCLLLLV